MIDWNAYADMSEDEFANQIEKWVNERTTISNDEVLGALEALYDTGHGLFDDNGLDSTFERYAKLLREEIISRMGRK